MSNITQLNCLGFITRLKIDLREKKAIHGPINSTFPYYDHSIWVGSIYIGIAVLQITLVVGRH